MLFERNLSKQQKGINNMTKIAFPGLGIDWFEINPTAFTVFGVDIQWYGIILSLGIVAAFLLFYRLATKKEQIVADTVYNITLLVVTIAIVCARFFYVITKWSYFKDKSFLEMINIRNGGIAIYGAIIFGLLTVLIYNKIKKTSSLSMLDALAPAVMLGQIIGRWGNFVNGEAYGWSEGVEKLPWRMELERVYIDGALQPEIHFVHPTFLYESLLNLIGLLLILFVFYRRKKVNGQIFFAYMGWYGFGRMFIELLRTDSLYILEGLFGKKIKFSVVVGVVCFLTSVIALIILKKRSKTEKIESDSYHSEFSSLKVAVQNEGDALDQSVFEQDGTETADEESTEIEEPEENAETEEEPAPEAEENAEEPESELEIPDEDESQTLMEQDMLDGSDGDMTAPETEEPEGSEEKEKAKTENTDTDGENK